MMQSHVEDPRYGDDRKYGGNLPIDGKIAQQYFFADGLYVLITLPEKLLIPRIKVFTHQVPDDT